MSASKVTPEAGPAAVSGFTSIDRGAFAQKVKPASVRFYEASQTRERISVLSRTREGSPKHLFRLHERFHLTLVLRHSDNGYVMGLDRF